MLKIHKTTNALNFEKNEPLAESVTATLLKNEQLVLQG